MKEIDLYENIVEWLDRFLRERFPRNEIIVTDTHKVKLSRYIDSMNGKKMISLVDTFDIYVDVTGIIKRQRKWDLVFVEVKLREITLKDLGQLLGYCMVASPKYAFLVSPKGASESIRRLVLTYGRRDILCYNKRDMIRICRWADDRNEVDPQSIIPRGMHL